jgi:hypothetical protein
VGEIKCGDSCQKLPQVSDRNINGNTTSTAVPLSVILFSSLFLAVEEGDL